MMLILEQFKGQLLAHFCSLCLSHLYTNNLCRLQLPFWQWKNRVKRARKLHERDKNSNEMVFEQVDFVSTEIKNYFEKIKVFPKQTR